VESRIDCFQAGGRPERFAVALGAFIERVSPCPNFVEEAKIVAIVSHQGIREEIDGPSPELAGHEE
jgi:hypothetical protein